MAGSEDLTVVAADLISHAGHLDTHADAVETARQAGEATTPGANAYGHLCWMVPIMLGQLQGVVVNGIEAGTESLRDVAAQLRTTAAAYQDTDTTNAAAIHGVQGSGQ